MKKKKIIKAKPWQIFSYYIMPFILGIITFFGFAKICLSGSYNKLYTLFDLINEFNQKTMLSLLFSLLCIGMGYLIYWSVYVDEGKKDNKINFNNITFKSIIIPLLAIIAFYFLPNIFVFLHNIFWILIRDEKYKYTYLLIHILWTYSIFGLIYYKDKDIVKIIKIHYSFVLPVFMVAILGLAICSEEHFITVILEHRLRTIFLFWLAFSLPFITYCATCDKPNYTYKDFLFECEDESNILLLASGCLAIGPIIYYCLSDSFDKVCKYLGNSLYNLIMKVNSVSYIPVILTTLTVIFIGFAIYKTRKYLEEK